MLKLIRDLIYNIFQPHHDKVCLLSQIKVQSTDEKRIAELERRRSEAAERHEKPFHTHEKVERVEPRSYLLGQLDKASEDVLSRRAQKRRAIPPTVSHLDDKRAKK